MSAEPRRDPMMQRRVWKDDGRRCVHCRWGVEIRVSRDSRRSIGCTDPRCCYGQAKWDGACCGWEREPGADVRASPQWNRSTNGRAHWEGREISGMTPEPPRSRGDEAHAPIARTGDNLDGS